MSSSDHRSTYLKVNGKLEISNIGNAFELFICYVDYDTNRCSNDTVSGKVGGDSVCHADLHTFNWTGPDAALYLSFDLHECFEDVYLNNGKVWVV